MNEFESGSPWALLRKERLNRGITQEEMAQTLGHSCRNAYGMKELGKRYFTVEEALIISRVLGVSVEFLFRKIS